MLKAALRKEYRGRRMALGSGERDKLQDLALIRFQQLGLAIPDVVMSFAAIEKFNEFDPDIITRYCRFCNPGLIELMPVVQKDGSMLATVIGRDTEYALNAYAIPEPVGGPEFPASQIDMVLLPLLAFDVHGNRVGYGKGYYDRFLANCRKDVLKIGFSFFDACDDISDVNPQDIKLDLCITAFKTYQF